MSPEIYMLRKWTLNRLDSLERHPSAWGPPVSISLHYQALLEILIFCREPCSTGVAGFGIVKSAAHEVVRKRWPETRTAPLEACYLAEIEKFSEEVLLMEQVERSYLFSLLGEVRDLCLSSLEQLSWASEPELTDEKKHYHFVQEHRPDLYRRALEVGLSVSLSAGEWNHKAAVAEDMTMSIVADLVQEIEQLRGLGQPPTRQGAPDEGDALRAGPMQEPNPAAS